MLSTICVYWWKPASRLLRHLFTNYTLSLGRPFSWLTHTLASAKKNRRSRGWSGLTKIVTNHHFSPHYR
jgi:hypothetical protein